MKDLTQNQNAVYRHLRTAARPQSAYDILDGVREQGLRAPQQIYRALKALTDRGLVHRVESLNAFIACDLKHKNNRIVFSICDDCGTVEEMAPVDIPPKLKHMSQQSGFQTRKMVIELVGTCSDCGQV